jgi:hypothetical protein
MPNILQLVPSLTALVVAFPLAAQQQQARRSQFVVTKGNDTIAVELFSRDGNALTSEIYQKNGPRTQYTMDLKPDSSISHVEFTRVTQNNQSIGISIFFLDSTVKAQMSAAGQTEQFEFASRKAIPILVVSFALCEQIVLASHRHTLSQGLGDLCDAGSTTQSGVGEQGRDRKWRASRARLDHHPKALNVTANPSCPPCD